MSSKLVFEFDSVEELLKHVSHLSELETIKKLVNKPDKKEHDQRGAHITGLHEQAKIYHNEHPEIRYHECIKIVSKLNKQNI